EWVFSQEGGGGQVASSSSSPGRSQTVSTGFVWVDGVYVSPPYVVQQRGNEVSLNGHSLHPRGGGMPVAKPSRWEPGKHGGDRVNNAERQPGETSSFARSRRTFARSPEVRGRRWRGARSAGINDIVRVLTNGGATVLFDGEFTASFSRNSAAYILDELLSDTSEATAATRANSLFGVRGNWGRVSPVQWLRIVGAFDPPKELRERAEALIESEDARSEFVEKQLQTSRWYQVLRSESVRYTITVTGMLLAVVALGNLLLYRPSGRGQWSDVTDGMADGLDMRRIVILLGLLGSFDLLLTLAAQQAGGFMELNPMGSELITTPLGLAAFKLISLIVSCSILLRLRHYRGAQIASWWLCMICTVLTFRWVTFNSLFMT
ncbi:MAG: DUF5658 family protein, partial [Planctomycetota bacterium]